MCDRRGDINQHAANLLCQSLNLGFNRAKEGKGTGWFNRGELYFVKSELVYRL